MRHMAADEIGRRHLANCRGGIVADTLIEAEFGVVTRYLRLSQADVRVVLRQNVIPSIFPLVKMFVEEFLGASLKLLYLFLLS